MRKKLFLATSAVVALAFATEIMAWRPPPVPKPKPQPPKAVSGTVYNLFLHGRSGDSHCAPLNNVNDGKSDRNGYYTHKPTGVKNVRYVGFDGTKKGGAYSWSGCGAQSQLHKAFNTFCRGTNKCRIFTHSTGGLVAAYYIYNSGTRGLNLLDVRLLANASGGSELADISTRYLGWLGFDTMGGELDNSVSTRGARTWNHNDTDGHTIELTSGEKSDYWGVTSPLLPGQDDGVLANHTLCGINRVAKIDASCPIGSGRIRESYRCGFLWLSKCHRNYYRFSNHKTLILRKYDTHRTSQKHYK